MANRYRVALAKGPEAYKAAIDEDEALLAFFGLRLTAVDGGLSAIRMSEVRGPKIHPWHLHFIDFKTWSWIRPLLVELRCARERGEEGSEEMGQVLAFAR